MIEDYSAINVPVLAVSGWVDGYTRVVFDLVENLDVPRKGIIGPWGHKYPQDGIPGPAIGFLQEATRWWDRWLKGHETAVEADPDMRLFVQGSEVPASHFDERRGRWVGFETWPAQDVQMTAFVFEPDGLLRRSAPEPDADRKAGTGVICSPVTTGLAAGQWCAYGQGKIAPELATDQRADDIGSLTYTTDVLTEPLHLIGEPTITLRVSSDQPSALVAVRVSDVRPDGSVERLSYGIFNLCHHQGHDAPVVLVPDEAVTVTFKLKGIAQTIETGHRVRISLSNSYSPMIWPSPSLTTLTVYHDGTSVTLPNYTTIDHLPTPQFEPPESASSGGVSVLRKATETRHFINDLGANTTEYLIHRDDGDYRLDDIGTQISFTRTRSTIITNGAPLSARVVLESTASYRRAEWDARVASHVTMHCDAESFYFTASLTAHEGDELFATRTFNRTIPRNFI